MMIVESLMNFGLAIISLVFSETFSQFTIIETVPSIFTVLGIVWILIGLYCLVSVITENYYHAKFAILISTIPIIFILGIIFGEIIVRLFDITESGAKRTNEYAALWAVPFLIALIANRWSALRFSRFAPKKIIKDRSG